DSRFAAIKADCEEEVYALYMDVIREEKAWADYLFNKGPVIGLNANILKDFVDYTARGALHDIGIKYLAPSPKSTPIPWFNKHSDTSKKQTALQENESTNYVPASPNDNLFEENSAKKSIICAYKLYESDAALGIKRYDWTSETKYSEYDDRLELDKNQLKYYVINKVESKYRVYKCLNNSNNGVSTDPPTGNGVEEEYKSDGYVWKFLYEIPEEMEKFITSDYVPVPIIDGLFYSDERSLQLYVQNNSKPGAIEELTFKNSENSVTPLAQEDVINPEFTNIACKIIAKETDSTGNVFITISTSSLSDPIFLSTTNGYYNDNYVMVIRSGTEGDIVATIKNYLM
ncbi:MAG: hypothetical protein ACO3UU_17085, partial [Minisyncoccia bacterium]